MSWFSTLGLRALQFAVLTLALTAVSALGAETRVDATQAYREVYGPPPKTEAVRCLAAVVYLPGVGTSADPNRLSALPLFSVNPDRVAEEAARILVEGHPTAVRLFEPPKLFPRGSKLLAVQIQGGVARVRTSLGNGGNLHPLTLQALAHTLTQFPTIRSVVLQLEGKPEEAAAPKMDLVEPPPPPRLLDVVASVHEGEDPLEIAVLFDRPVDVFSVGVRLGDGTGLPGKTFASMFDMAVVFRPVDPKIIREGLPLEIAWDVRDKTGRAAKGKQSVGLRLYRHTE